MRGGPGAGRLSTFPFREDSAGGGGGEGWRAWGNFPFFPFITRGKEIRIAAR